MVGQSMKVYWCFPQRKRMRHWTVAGRYEDQVLTQSTRLTTDELVPKGQDVEHDRFRKVTGSTKLNVKGWLFGSVTALQNYYDLEQTYYRVGYHLLLKTGRTIRPRRTKDIGYIGKAWLGCTWRGSDLSGRRIQGYRD